MKSPSLQSSWKWVAALRLGWDSRSRYSARSWWSSTGPLRTIGGPSRKRLSTPPVVAAGPRPSAAAATTWGRRSSRPQTADTSSPAVPTYSARAERTSISSRPTLQAIHSGPEPSAAAATTWGRRSSRPQTADTSSPAAPTRAMITTCISSRPTPKARRSGPGPSAAATTTKVIRSSRPQTADTSSPATPVRAEWTSISSRLTLQAIHSGPGPSAAATTTMAIPFSRPQTADTSSPARAAESSI